VLTKVTVVKIVH